MNVSKTTALLACIFLAVLGGENKAKTKEWKWYYEQACAAAMEYLKTERLSAENGLMTAQNGYDASRERSAKLRNEMAKLERRKHKLISEIAHNNTQEMACGHKCTLIRAHKGRYSAVNVLDDAMRAVSAKHREELRVQAELLSEIEHLRQRIWKLEREIASPQK